MPTNVWQSVDTDWDNTDNWSLGAKPVDNDSVIFPADATVDCLLNLNQGSTGPLQIRIEEGCPVSIGDDSERLNLQGAASTLYHLGIGSFYINASFADVVLDAPNWVDAIDVDGAVIKRLTILQGKFRGKTDGTSACVITHAFISSIRGEFIAVLDLGSSSSNSITNLLMTGGRVTTGRVNTALVTGGVWTQNDQSSDFEIALTMAGGVFKGNSTHPASSTPGDISSTNAIGTNVITRGVADFRGQSIPRRFNGFIHPGGYLLAPDNLTINGGALLREPIIT